MTHATPVAAALSVIRSHGMTDEHYRTAAAVVRALSQLGLLYEPIEPGTPLLPGALPAEPVLPPEPPCGTVLYGDAGGSQPDLWQRDDSTHRPSEEKRWWHTGFDEPVTWATAFGLGADPSRRLLELPDPDDAHAIGRLTSQANQLEPAGHYVSTRVVRAAVRALAERRSPA